MKLTQEEIDELHTWLNSAAVGNMDVERPVVHSPHRLEGEGVVLGGKRSLSQTTRRSAEKKLADAQRKEKARAARAAQLPKGRRHHKKKKATRDRAALKRWTEQPYKSLVYGYGNWQITQEQWDRLVAPLWLEYKPQHLTVKRKWGKGTKTDPYTIYDIDVYHKGERVYRGEDWFIYDKSSPSEEDIKKAPEGAELFTDRWWLSGEKLKLLRHLERNGLQSKLLYGS